MPTPSLRIQVVAASLLVKERVAGRTKPLELLQVELENSSAQVQSVAMSASPSNIVPPPS